MRTRFAPSPTGPLHLGHAYSAILAHDMARAEGGAFLLRIEDIDQGRARPEWEALIFEDLRWLGLSWEEPVMRQSERSATYHAALTRLWTEGLVYPCNCNRRDIHAAASAPNEGTPLVGPDGVVYPGTCRPMPPTMSQPNASLPDASALRLDMAKTLARLSQDPITFFETGKTVNGKPQLVTRSLAQTMDTIGDVALARHDMGTSYHLSVVIDDDAQGVTHVVRGDDLFDATKIHVILQRLLRLPTPTYHHHPLIRDDAGKRLAKRDEALAIRTYRKDGATPADIRRMVGL